jgi:hypothetical protein
VTDQVHPRDPVDEAEPAQGRGTARERIAPVDGEPAPHQGGTSAEAPAPVVQDPAADEADDEPSGELPSDDDELRSPSSRRAAAAWYAGPAGPTLSFGFNLAKIPGQGEDADPIVRDGRDLGLVAVFDGMGGAGGTAYETPEGRRTGAYLASRVARDVVEERLLALLDPEWNLDAAAAARDLQRSVRRALADTLAGLNPPKSGLRSRLLRALPTTMA